MFQKITHDALPPAFFSHLLSLEINRHDFQKYPPVLIYQFGKVGSSTVRKSLRQSALPNPIYQVHSLSDAGIQRYEAKRQQFPHSRYIAECLAISKSLRRKINNLGTDSVPLRIITLTREPIALLISSFFEAQSDRLSKSLDDDNHLVLEEIMKKIRRQLKRFDESSNRVCTWFDRELNATFGIDIFAHPFSPEMGYQIIRQGNIELLLLRLEDLNQCGSQVLAEFLQLDQPLSLISVNQRDKKEFADLYQTLKETIQIPKRICRPIYASQYATHFYSDAERDAFIHRWSEGLGAVAN